MSNPFAIRWTPNKGGGVDFFGPYSYPYQYLMTSAGGLVFDFDAQTNVTSSAGSLTAWTDARLGITTTIPATKPTYSSTAINNYPAITVGSGSAVITTNTLSPTNSANFTLFTVLRYLGGGGSLYQYFATAGGWTTGNIHLFINQLTINPTADQALTAPAINGNYIIMIQNTTNASGNNSSVYRVNGVNQSTVSSGGNGTNIQYTKVNLGGWDGDAGRWLNANYGEFILFNKMITSAEITAVEQYLSKKWQIGIGSTPVISSSSPIL